MSKPARISASGASTKAAPKVAPKATRKARPGPSVKKLDKAMAGQRAPAQIYPPKYASAVYVASSAIHGKGMFAARRLPSDLSLGRLEGMPTYDDGIYVLWLDDELGLEVTCDFKYINHSKDPNCELTGIDVVTLRAIERDEELTHDYGW